MTRSFTLLFTAVLTALITFAGLPGQDMDSRKDFDAKWQQVDKLLRENKTRSALNLTDEIYFAASKKGLSDYLVKAFSKRLELQLRLEDADIEKVYTDYKKEISSSESPVKQLLQVFLAAELQTYLNRNRYQISGRTPSIQAPEDPAEWAEIHFKQEISDLYLEALQLDGTIESYLSKDFPALLVKNKTSPTCQIYLYELLAEKAVDYFKSSTYNENESLSPFSLDKEIFFESASQFTLLDLPSDDPLSSLYNLGRTYQRLLKFQIGVKSPDFSRTDIARLELVYNESNSENKDELLKERLIESYSDSQDEVGRELYRLELAKQLIREGRRYKFPNSDYRWKLKEAVELLELLKEQQANSYVSKMSRFELDQLKRAEVNFKMSSVIPKDHKSLFLLEYKNTSSVKFEIKNWTEADQSRISRMPYNDRKNYILSRETIREFALNCEDPGDFQKHSTEWKIQGLDFGRYVVVAIADGIQVDGKHIDHSFIKVSNMAVLEHQKENKLSYVLTDRKTGKGLADIEVNIYKKEWSRMDRKMVEVFVEKGKTTKDGFYCFSSENSRASYFATFTNGEDKINSNDKNLYTHAKQKDYLEHNFFLDRAIYRPGQNLFFKIISSIVKHDVDNELAKNLSLEVSLFDANGQIVEKNNYKGNDYGSINGSFVLPEGLLTGYYSLRCGNYSKSFKVEEYKRPSYKVELDNPEGENILGDEITLKGKIESYAGAGLSEANIKYRIVRKPIWRPYYYFYGRSHFPNEQGEAEIAQGNTISSQNGSFNIEFLARANKSGQSGIPFASLFEIVIDAIDQNGEQIQYTKQLTIGSASLKLESNLPQIINPDNFKQHELRIENFQGEGQKAELLIELYRLKNPESIKYDKSWSEPDMPLWSETEFKNEFPHIAYNQENKATKFEIAELIKSTGISADSKISLGKFYKENLSEGYYKLVVKTRDKNENEVELVLFPTVMNQTEKSIKIIPTLEIIANKKELEVGENLEISFVSGIPNQNVFIQIDAPKETLYKKWIKINGNKEKIKIPISESFRGGLKIQAIGIENNHIFSSKVDIAVPFTNKELILKWESFRDKLIPNEKSTWKLNITDKKGNAVQAELLASMYDASLDYFERLQWSFGSSGALYNAYSSWGFGSQFGLASSSTISSQVITSRPASVLPCYQLDLHQSNYRMYSTRARGGRLATMEMAMDAAAPGALREKGFSTDANSGGDDDGANVDKSGPPSVDNVESESSFPLRKNFNETAFFFPQLNTNAQGDVDFTFTVPESLTEWNFSAFAHSSSLMTGMLSSKVKTQQDFMIQALTPRFLRENDTIVLTARLSNLTDEDQEILAQLDFTDLSERLNLSKDFLLEQAKKSVKVKANSTSSVSWKLAIPRGDQDMVILKVSAQNASFKDGEQHPLPILKNSMMVIESINLPISANSSRSFVLEKLSNLLDEGKVHSLSLEVTSNPVWLAIQSLPYILEYPYDCNEQIFSRVFANSIASHIANSDDRIKSVFEEWNDRPEEDLISPLEKNSDLKSILLQESPWVREAQSESERMRRIAVLFDLKKMDADGKKALAKLQKQQNWDGGFSWFKTGRSNRFISQHIASGFGQLAKLNIKQHQTAEQITTKLIRYLDQIYSEDLKRYKRHLNFNPDNNYFSENAAHYLYTRSFYSDIAINDEAAFTFWTQQAEKFGQKRSIYSRAMLAIAFHRTDKRSFSAELLEGIKQNSITRPDLGSFFNGLNGYRWYQSDIETQATVIEAFEECTSDAEFVEDLKTWLLKHKQTNQWKSTKATALACYALLLQGQYWLAESKDLEVTTGDGSLINADNKQAGTGYFRKDFTSSDLNTSFSEINLKNENKVAAWASAYWKYFEELDKIDHFDGNLKIRKEYALISNSNIGPVYSSLTRGKNIKVGDKILVRLVLDVDREMDFVHLKDQRASGMEPVRQLSGYQYNNGLSYYQSVRDASANFFFDHLPRGRHVFEYELKAIQEGSFSTGITTFSSMYAPEFSSHSSGIRLNILAQK